jgi:Transposase DDE domain group 1
VKNSARGSRVTVSADGRGLVSQAGAVLLWETMRVTGLGRGLSLGLARWRAPRAVHDPGKVVADLPRALKAVRSARAQARERAWALAGESAPGGGGGGLVTVDLDATIVTAHSEKEQAAPAWKKTFGFHPVTACAGHGGTGNGEPLAIVLRPGNAGSNTAADHIEAARLALAQLPRHLRGRVLVRTDSGGGTREFLTWLTARSWPLRYSVGMTLTDDV